MRPRTARFFTLLVGCLAACLFSQQGCTFEDGSPWARAAFELDAAFDPAERRADDGRLRVGNGYELELTSLSLDFGIIALAITPEGVSLEEFDPADPPAGYSLCHNGHCHADDGRLVDYEDIALELATGGSDAPGVEQAVDARVTFEDEVRASAPIDESACAAGCDVPRGELLSVRHTITSVEIKGRVFDTNKTGRLPDDGLAVDFVVPGPFEFSTAVEGSVDQDSSQQVLIQAEHIVSVRLFDGVDWTDATTWRETISSNILEHNSFTASITR